MAPVRDVGVGLALTALSWALLEWTQYSWWVITSQAVRAPLAEALALVAAGAALLLVARSRVVRPLAGVVAAVLLAAAVAPAVVGAGAWWPQALPGSAERLASFPGTYLAIGMWLAAARSAAVARQPRTETMGVPGETRS